jgi:hypothetical protein
MRLGWLAPARNALSSSVDVGVEVEIARRRAGGFLGFMA